MPDVSFGEEQSEMSPYSSRKILGSPIRPSILTLVRKIGLAKNDSQAYYIMLGLIVFFFIASLTVCAFIFLGNPSKKTTNHPNLDPRLKTIQLPTSQSQ